MICLTGDINSVTLNQTLMPTNTIFINTTGTHIIDAFTETGDALLGAIGEDGKVDYMNLPVEDMIRATVYLRMLSPKLPRLARELERCLAEKLRIKR